MALRQGQADCGATAMRGIMLLLDEFVVVRYHPLTYYV